MTANESPDAEGRRPRPAKPTPVRTLRDTSSGATQQDAPPPESVSFQVAGRAWVAEEMGRAEGWGGSSILLVRFMQPEAVDGSDDGDPAAQDRAPEPPLEAWVVGAGLTEVGLAALIEALGRAEPWKGLVIDRPFFADEGGRRGR